MYPGLFLWWNPVINFPLSGSVTQEFEQRVNRQMRLVRDTMVEITKHLPESEKNLSPALKEHLFALNAQLDTLNQAVKLQ